MHVEQYTQFAKTSACYKLGKSYQDMVSSCRKGTNKHIPRSCHQSQTSSCQIEWRQRVSEGSIDGIKSTVMDIPVYTIHCTLMDPAKVTTSLHMASLQLYLQTQGKSWIHSTLAPLAGNVPDMKTWTKHLQNTWNGLRNTLRIVKNPHRLLSEHGVLWCCRNFW